MARRQEDITIRDEGRDKDKVFRIREKSAADAEWWAFRAILAIGRSGVDLGGITPDMGMNGIAILGLTAFFKLDPPVIKPLMDEMWKCITAVPSADVERALVEDDTEEVMTRFRLRAEVMSLHVGFSVPGMLLKGSTSAAAAPGPAS